MYNRKSTSGSKSTDKILDDIYRVLNTIEVGTTASRYRQYYGIPIYLNHTLAPTPQTGYVTTYFLHNDYDFMYFKWSDGSRHNRRLPISMEEDE